MGRKRESSPHIATKRLKAYDKRAREKDCFKRDIGIVVDSGQGNDRKVRVVHCRYQPEAESLYKDKVMQHEKIPHYWKQFSRPGTMLVYDKASKKLTAIIRIQNLDRLSIAEADMLKMTIDHCVEDSHCSVGVHNNGAANKAQDKQGSMGAMGYRKAMVQGQAYGEY